MLLPNYKGVLHCWSVGLHVSQCMLVCELLNSLLKEVDIADAVCGMFVYVSRNSDIDYGPTSQLNAS